MLDTPLEIKIKKDNEKYWVVEFVGNLDSYGLTEKRKEIAEIIDTVDKPHLVFDFTELEYINSESIGVLMQINEKLTAKDKKLVIVHAKKNVIDVLQVIGLFETVAYYETLDEFVKGLANAN